MKVFWFDTETTGTDELEHGIIQLACIVEIDGRIEEERNYRMNPFKWRPGINLEALRINGITIAEILNYPQADEVKKQIEAVLAYYVDRYDKHDKFFAAGFKVDFDMRFLRELWSFCEDPYFNSWFHFSTIDPIRIIPVLNYMNALNYRGKLTLEQLAKSFDVCEPGAHDAMVDIRMTRNIMLKICERFCPNAEEGVEYAAGSTAK